MFLVDVRLWIEVKDDHIEYPTEQTDKTRMDLLDEYRSDSQCSDLLSFNADSGMRSLTS